MTPNCPYCCIDPISNHNIPIPAKFGFFRRSSRREKFQRFKCRTCLRTFSDATRDPCFRQRKREVNQKIFELLVSGVSQRRASMLLKLNRKTVVRKFIFLGHLSFTIWNLENLNSSDHIGEIEFDELETFEHTKCKPLSVPLAVESKTRKILGFYVARMPAKGHLAKIAMRKYGHRLDERVVARKFVHLQIAPLLSSKGLIKSDQNPHYPAEIKTYLPNFSHETSKGQRGAITGQGELKKTGYDPLFSLNHTCAMLRANINRLFRKTWCTTKKPERLALHIAMYALFHNQMLIKK